MRSDGALAALTAYAIWSGDSTPAATLRGSRLGFSQIALVPSNSA